MKTVRYNEGMKKAHAQEFKKLTEYITDIQNKTEKAFNGTSTITVERFLKSLVNSADIDSNITPDQRVTALKIIRKIIESANTNPEVAGKPASNWETE